MMGLLNDNQSEISSIEAKYGVKIKTNKFSVGIQGVEKKVNEASSDVNSLLLKLQSLVVTIEVTDKAIISELLKLKEKNQIGRKITIRRIEKLEGVASYIQPSQQQHNYSSAHIQ